MTSDHERTKTAADATSHRAQTVQPPTGTPCRATSPPRKWADNYSSSRAASQRRAPHRQTRTGHPKVSSVSSELLQAILQHAECRIAAKLQTMFEEGFYPTVDSCQIPNLEFLLRYYLGSRSDGFYVEVGGYDGMMYSNTYGLAYRGWRGILIEPIAEYADTCKKAYSSYPQVEVVETAIGSSPGVSTIFIGGCLSSTNSQAIEQFRRIGWGQTMITGETRTVNTSTLDNLLDLRDWPQEFDLLVVDVEGSEGEVFDGFSLERWKPKMIIAELHDGCPILALTRATDWALQRRICSVGYSIIFKDHINTDFVREDVARMAHSEL